MAHEFQSAEDIVGLDLANGYVSAARSRVGADGAVHVLSAGWADVPPTATDQELAAAIRKVWRSAGMPSWTVCASLRSRSVLVRHFSYPAMRRDELVAALRLEAEESLQLPIQEIALDWHVNPLRGAPSPSGTRPYTGLLVAAPKKDIARQMSVMRLAGLYPVAIDLPATAIGNLFLALDRQPGPREDCCVLHLTRQRADLALLFDGEGIYARTLYARGESWSESPDHLVEGIQDAMKYYVFKLRGMPVRRLVVTGPMPEGPRFLDRLRDDSDVLVELWNPLGHVKPGSLRAGHALAEAGSPLAVSIGLSLRRYAGE